MREWRRLDMPGSASLTKVAEHFGLARRGAHHGALEDAWLALMIYMRLRGMHYSFPFERLGVAAPLNLRAPPG